ncbi:MAG TPA: hypothetical protein VNO30_04055 [Kofleriaceae bacterium]|nr:hypothetical protein [Kofleriaceae bacterium]
MSGGGGGNDSAFLPARAKLRIASIDHPDLQICAQYNPKELSITKSIKWEPHKDSDNKTERNNRSAQSQQDDLSFGGGEPRTITIEFLFDGYETQTSIEPDVEALEKLSSVQDSPSNDSALKRPHHCIITWGIGNQRMRPFLCVINKLDVKYQMWDTTGLPLRATCTISVTEAIRMKSQASGAPAEVEGRRERGLRPALRPRPRG